LLNLDNLYLILIAYTTLVIVAFLLTNQFFTALPHSLARARAAPGMVPLGATEAWACRALVDPPPVGAFALFTAGEVLVDVGGLAIFVPIFTQNKRY
jgi:hypothetical protein